MWQRFLTAWRPMRFMINKCIIAEEFMWKFFIFLLNGLIMEWHAFKKVTRRQKFFFRWNLWNHFVNGTTFIETYARRRSDDENHLKEDQKHIFLYSERCVHCLRARELLAIIIFPPAISFHYRSDWRLPKYWKFSRDLIVWLTTRKVHKLFFPKKLLFFAFSSLHTCQLLPTITRR